MKKVFFGLICTLLMMGLFVACSNTNPIIEEEVLSSVCFDNSASATKALSADITGLDIDGAYWFYTAVKTDGGVATGQTGDTHNINDKEPVAVDESGNPCPGITDKVVTGFSAGKWTFRLYGYSDRDGNIPAFNCPWTAEDTKGAGAILKGGYITGIAVPVEPIQSPGAGYLQFNDISAEGAAVLKYRYKTWDAVAGNWSSDWTVWNELTTQPTTTERIYSIKCLIEVGAFYPDALEKKERISVYLYDGLTTVISGSVDTPVVEVTYDSNEADSGDVPVDANGYIPGESVTVLGNSGTLIKTGYIWGGWNTESDGSGDDYAAGSAFTIFDNTTLYAKWVTLTYDGNGATSGSAPESATSASPTVTVAGNTGGLVIEGKYIDHWNTSADDSGTSYEIGSSINITEDTTLYAIWEDAVVSNLSGANTKMFRKNEE